MVTGAGRCRGIGAVVCRTLAEKGADVFFTLAFLYFLLSATGAIVGILA